MPHPLGVYWAVAHRRPQDYNFFLNLQVPVVKIMDGGLPDYAWVHNNLPNALVVARDWSLSEQHDDVRRDPVATGKRHAREWVTHQKRLGFDIARTLVLGQNEPRVWEDMSCVPYNVAFLDECALLGLRAGALNLSVGWPANNGPDTPPDWTPYEPVHQAIKRGNHVLTTHEYWADLGPQENWGWWGGRTLRCPWDVPILIGECGFEMAVKRPVTSMWDRGWQAHISAQMYADQLVEYSNRMAADSRIVGLCTFLCDYQNNEWASLDLEPAYNEILARRGALRPVSTTPTTPPGQPPTQPPPQLDSDPLGWPLDSGTVTQRYGENPDRYAPWGLRGHNGVDIAVPVGTQVKAVADGVVVTVDTDWDGYGLYVELWHPPLRLRTLYAHLVYSSVKTGDFVNQGQTIALSGSSGNSTGPHLHYEVRAYENAVTPEWVYRMSKGAIDPVSVRMGLERGVALPDAPPPPTAGQLAPLIVAAARSFGVRPALLASLAWAESSFRPGVTSQAGAQGMTQIMPETWAEWAPRVGATDPFDAKDNLRVGAAYLGWLLKTLGNEWAAVGAYLMGIGNVLEGVELTGQNLVYVIKVIHGADLLQALAGAQFTDGNLSVFLPLVR